MTTMGGGLSRIIYEQQQQVNRSHEDIGESGAIIMRRVVEYSTATITTLTISGRGPIYYCDDAPSGISDASSDSAIADYFKAS